MTIELNADDLSSLIVALGDYIRLMAVHGNLKGSRRWEWIENFNANLRASEAGGDNGS